MNSSDWLGSIKVKGGRVGIGVELLIWFFEINDNEVEIYGIIECIGMKEINLFVIYALDWLGRDLGVYSSSRVREKFGVCP